MRTAGSRCRRERGGVAGVPQRRVGPGGASRGDPDRPFQLERNTVKAPEVPFERGRGMHLAAIAGGEAVHPAVGQVSEEMA
jgi:hypothetical protein